MTTKRSPQFPLGELPVEMIKIHGYHLTTGFCALNLKFFKFIISLIYKVENRKSKKKYVYKFPRINIYIRLLLFEDKVKTSQLSI